jgi:hypothetical protein
MCCVLDLVLSTMETGIADEHFLQEAFSFLTSKTICICSAASSVRQNRAFPLSFLFKFGNADPVLVTRQVMGGVVGECCEGDNCDLKVVWTALYE